MKHLKRFSVFATWFLLVSLWACENIPVHNGIQTFDFGENDFALTACTLQSGSIIIGGSTNSIRDNQDMLIMCVDDNNNTVWSKSAGGKTSDRCYAVIELEDHSIIAVGSVQISAGNNDMLVLRLNKAGAIMWSRNFGGPLNEEGRSVIQSSDGSIVIVGSTSSFGTGRNDVFLVKISLDGRLIWQRTFGTVNADVGRSIKQLKNGDYIVTGYASNGIYPFHTLLLKVNQTGEEIWSNVYIMGESSEGRSVDVLPDGSYIVSGSTHLSRLSDNRSSMALRADENGNVIWHKNYSLGNNEANQGIILRDNIYAVAGFLTSSRTNAFVMTVDVASGEQTAIQTYGSSGNSSANALIKKGSDYYIVGWIEYDKVKKQDVFIEKLNF